MRRYPESCSATGERGLCGKKRHVEARIEGAHECAVQRKNNLTYEFGEIRRPQDIIVGNSVDTATQHGSVRIDECVQHQFRPVTGFHPRDSDFNDTRAALRG
jgi:hypothetical protein